MLDRVVGVGGGVVASALKVSVWEIPATLTSTVLVPGSAPRVRVLSALDRLRWPSRSLRSACTAPFDYGKGHGYVPPIGSSTLVPDFHNERDSLTVRRSPRSDYRPIFVQQPRWDLSVVSVASVTSKTDIVWEILAVARTSTVVGAFGFVP